MALAARSFHWVPNSDATLDGRWRRGNKPTVVASSLGIDLVAFNAANILLTGLSPSAQSFNYRQYLTGTSAATATLSVNAASGSLGGWTISGNNLTNTGVVGSGALFVSADDGAGTIVNFPVQAWSIVSTSTGYKAHRGHYAWNTGWKPNVTTDTTFMNSAGMAKFKGIQIEPRWSALEGNTQGDYSKADALIDSYLAACQTANKRLMVKMNERVFGTPSGTNPGGFPLYAVNGGMVTIPASGSGAGFSAIASVWQDNCAQAIQNLWTHILQRYDSNPYFEMGCPYEETTINWTGLGGDHAVAWYQVLKDNFTAWRKAASQTLLRFLCNFVEGDPACLSLFTTMKQLGGIVFGGPDPQVPKGAAHYPLVVGGNFPSQFRTIQASNIFRGYQVTGSGTIIAQNYPDLGDQQIWCAEVQNLGIGYSSINSPADLLTYAHTFQKAQYHVWDTYTGADGTYKFTPDIVNAVNAVNGDGLEALPPGNWNTT